MTKLTGERKHLDDSEADFIELAQKHLVLFMSEAKLNGLCGDCTLATMASYCIAQIALRESSDMVTLASRVAKVADVLGKDAEVLALLLSNLGDTYEVNSAQKPH